MLTGLDKIYSEKSGFRNLTALIIVFIFYNCLFSHKALHIDDPFTIRMAMAINKDSMDLPRLVESSPFLLEYYYAPKIEVLLKLDNPLLLGYYYAPIVRLFPDNERWLHLFTLPFSLLVIISMYFLSLRFTPLESPVPLQKDFVTGSAIYDGDEIYKSLIPYRKGGVKASSFLTGFTGNGFLPTLFLVISPAFIITSQSIMLDIPLLGFFLSALATFIYGIDKHDKRLLFLSAILTGITCLIKYPGLLLILLMFIYVLMTSEKRYYLFLLIPTSIFFLLCIHNIIFYKRVDFLLDILWKIKEFSINPIPQRIFACLSFITGTSVISIFLIPYLLPKKNNFFLFLLSLSVGLCPFLLKEYFIEYNIIEKFFLVFLFLSSSFIILRFSLFSLVKNSYHKDNLFLSLWFFILLVFTILIQFIAARFVLLLFPPMFLFICRELILNKIFSKRVFNRLIFISVLITVFISTLLAIGDYHFAGVYREFLASLKRRLPSDKNIYFCPGHYYPFFSWGYAHYLYKYYPEILNMEMKENLNRLQDFVFISPSEPVLPIVIQKICSNEFQESDYEKNLIKRFHYQSNIILQHRKFHAGFYSHDWGLLPFYISLRKVPLETFDVYSLSR